MIKMFALSAKAGWLFLPVVIMVFMAPGCSDEPEEVVPHNPVAIVTEDPTDIGPFGMTLNGTISSTTNAILIEKGFLIGTGNSLLTRDACYAHVIVEDPGDRLFATVTGLDPLTTYYARGFAVQESGTDYGNIVSFTTEKLWSDAGTFTDSRDGRQYDWVTIGNQTWMAENLAYIPFVCDEFCTGIWVYDNYYPYPDYVVEYQNYRDFGCLYDFENAVLAVPEGWHLPSLNEWNELINYCGGMSDAGKVLKRSGSNYWNSFTGEEASGFNAVGGGRFYFNEFNYLKQYGYYWTASQEGDTRSWYIRFIDTSPYVYFYSYGYHGYGMSVRCIRDN